MSIRNNRLLLAAAALGFAIAGSVMTTSSADASPRHGGHGGGWGHHGGGHGGWGHGGWGHRPHWGHRPYGVIRIGHGGYGPRCRLVERENRWGEVVVRRICFDPRSR